MNLLQSFKFDLLVHGKLLIAAEARLNYQSCLLKHIFMDLWKVLKFHSATHCRHSKQVLFVGKKL